MRPRKLRIEGFTCFAEPQEIDFRGMDVFVISGPTGAGKTTIIDAMCYALYGKVPRDSTTTQLMSHNRDRLLVEMEFEANGHQYRVLRSINRVRKTGRDGTERVTRSVSPVELQQFEGGDWVSLEGRVARIDEAIESIVGLDFDAFQRCVLLPQGRFQEFLTGDRKKRSDILKDLLDLRVFERMMSAANQRHRDLERDAANNEKRLAEDFAGATPEALDACRAEIAEASAQLAATRDVRAALIEAEQLATKIGESLRHEKDARSKHESAVAGIEAERQAGASDATRLAELNGRIATLDEAIRSAGYDESAHRTLSVAREKARRASELETAHERAAARAEDRRAIEAAEATAAEAHRDLQAANDALRAAEEALTLAERAHAAEHVRKGLKQGDACPVCGGVIGKLPKGAAPAIAPLEKARDQARAIATKQDGAARAADQKAAVERQNLVNAAAEAARASAALLRAQAELAAATPAGIEPALKPIEAALTAQEEAARTHERLARELDQARSQLEAQQQAMRGRETAITRLETEATEAERRAEGARAEITRGMAELRETAARHAWREISAEIDAKRNPTDILKSLRMAADDDVQRLAGHLKQRERDAERIAEGIERAAELRTQAADARAQAALYHDLALLLRADAFQEFVISEAMTLLADTATQHLATLYPRFAMAVDGGEFQIVDHWQAGQQRPAKTLSGGETFVASLALALALAERLPELRRAAASRLESLFLDEGFGTLDRETLETVMEALEGLRSQERMVGIITHVPELSQRIETRIEITKSPAGSSVTVIGA